MAINLNCTATRLKQIRETLAYSVDEASQATGLAADRLTAIEHATARPSGDEILILASFYDCDFRALLDETLPPPTAQTGILFRRYGESFRPEDRRAVQEFLRLCQIEAELERLLRRQPKAFTFVPTGNYLKGHGKQAAEALRARFGYTDSEAPRDIYSDFRSVGIHVFRRKLANDEISGLYIEDPSAGHCVLINYNEDIYRQRFSVAHEVAHAIFDSSDGMMLTFESNSTKHDHHDHREIRANSFASNYLMPLTMLKRISSWDESSARHWAQEFRVSTAALAKALKDAKLVDESVARIIRSVRVPKEDKIDPEARLSLTASQRDRRKGLLERGLSNYYVDLCFSAHDQGLISTGRLAEILLVEHAELSDIGILFSRTLSHGI